VSGWGRKRTHRGSGRHKRRVSKRRGVMAALGAILTSTFVIAWLALGGALWLVAALLSGLATAMLAIATFNPDVVMPAKPPAAPKPGKRPGKKRPTDSSPRPGTKGQRPARKPVCSAACQRSRKPVDTCDCVCGGERHGVAA